ncbi:MAG: M23 family metallopeptidase [Bacteroidetes bacterium]|nr:M23 family metallopeptidase [Bacteroidota bacterium]
MKFYNKKYFKYIHETGKIVQGVDPKIYGLLMAFVSTLASLVIILFINKYYGNFMNIDFGGNEFLSNENRILKNEVLKLTTNYKDMTGKLQSLENRDNQLRMAVNLPTLANDEKLVGQGGSLVNSDENIYSNDLKNIISVSSQMINDLKNKIRFQKYSYEEINYKISENKDYLLSVPAIQPMQGVLIRHGSFGMRVHPILNVKKMHDGIDISNSSGTPVYASGRGTVSFAGNSSTGYGISIEINHGYEFETIYAHLSKIIVHRNQKVKRGDLIGYSGNTGLSTGPHLHYEVRNNGVNMNPVNYFFDDKKLLN